MITLKHDPSRLLNYLLITDSFGRNSLAKSRTDLARQRLPPSVMRGDAARVTGASRIAGRNARSRPNEGSPKCIDGGFAYC